MHQTYRVLLVDYLCKQKQNIGDLKKSQKAPEMKNMAGHLMWKYSLNEKMWYFLRLPLTEHHWPKDRLSIFTVEALNLLSPGFSKKQKHEPWHIRRRQI